MGRAFSMCVFKLCLVSFLSTFLGFLATSSGQAHEVTPTIADFDVQDSQLRLSFRLTAEAFVAGLDLDGMVDTDTSDRSSDYDDLRTLPPSEMAPMVRAFAEDWAPLMEMTVDGAGVDPVVGQILIPAVGDQALPRVSEITLVVDLPADAVALAFTWPDGSGGMVLRQHGVDDPFTGFFQGGERTPPIALLGGTAKSGWEVFVDYVPVGFSHILPKGADHILFVLALFFLSTRLVPLLWQISAFTLAHTLTLALGVLGLVSVPPHIVEPLIAASITFVAVENIMTDRLHRWRPVVVFGFGLLHGLGFASVLEQFGLPPGQLVAALLGFNVGVELGQLAVVAAAFLTVGLWFGDKHWYRGRIAMPASFVIALIGAWWFVERVFL